jgi:hypothetical protein
MRREQLEHVLRAASAIASDPDVLVIGSQSILGSIPDHLVPAVVTRSTEVDIAFFNRPAEAGREDVGLAQRRTLRTIAKAR